VWELAAALTARGHRVRVLYPAESHGAHGAFRGVERVPVPVTGQTRRPFGRDIAIGKNASRLIDPESTVVVGNDEKAGALSIPSGRNGHGPILVQVVHDVALHTFDTLRPLEPDGGIRQRLGNWVDRRTLKRLEGDALNRAAAVLIASELNRKLLTEYYRVPSGRVHLVPHGVPDPLEVGARADARLALHLPNDVPVIAFIGRTPERQGLPLALDAFRRVRQLFPGSRFVIVGSKVPSEAGVMVLGPVDESTKAQVLRAADLFLFPARYEGFGLAPREAMRYGVPAIVSAHVPMDGANLERDLRCVSTDDAGEYAAALAELIADPALRRQIGDAGKAYADQFSYPKMAERFEATVGPLVHP
jgi:glycosyltransferase involved in cell wall biosynthesis